MGDLMSLRLNALTWQGLTIGGGDSDVHLGEKITGFGRPPVSSDSVQRSMGGTWGGIDMVGDRTYGADVWLDCESGDDPNELDFSTLWDLDDSMDVRPHPDDELPLQWSGLMWPGEHCAFVRPRRCEWIVDEDGVHNGAPGLQLEWVGSDPAVYSADVDQRVWPTGAPVTADTFEVANAGRLRSYARRAFELRMTAHGAIGAPFVRVEHADGTREEITFEVEMTSGQVLTLGADLVPRVGSRMVGVHSLTEAGIVSRAARWWLLHPSTGSDGANVVSIGSEGGGGSLSGFLKTRSTW